MRSKIDPMKKVARMLRGHHPTDLFVTFSDEDFRLGFNAAQTTLAAVVRLVEARVAQ